MDGNKLRELEKRFYIEFTTKHHRAPEYKDAIKWTIDLMVERAWKECSLIFHEHGMTKDYEPRFRKAMEK